MARTAVSGWTFSAAAGYLDSNIAYLGNYGTPLLTSTGEYGVGINTGYTTNQSDSYRALLSKEIVTGPEIGPPSFE